MFISLLGTNDANNLLDFSRFWSPMSSDYDAGKEIEFHVQLGSIMFPKMPIKSTAESFSQLSKCLGIHGSPFHSLDISPDQYCDYSFILGLDFEKVLEAGFTGINSKSGGDLTTIKIKPVDSANYGAANPTKIFTVLHTDNILEIRDGGVTVFD